AKAALDLLVPLQVPPGEGEHIPLGPPHGRKRPAVGAEPEGAQAAVGAAVRCPKLHNDHRCLRNLRRETGPAAERTTLLSIRGRSVDQILKGRRNAAPGCYGGWFAGALRPVKIPDPPVWDAGHAWVLSRVRLVQHRRRNVHVAVLLK